MMVVLVLPFHLAERRSSADETVAAEGLEHHSKQPQFTRAPRLMQAH